MIGRRTLLAGVAGLTGAAATSFRSLAAGIIRMPFDNGDRPLVRYPQKRPLIRLTTRPPQLETPLSVFDEGVLTPNDAFFVRYHMSESPPLDLTAENYRLEIKGLVGKALSLSLADLKHNFAAVELVAVNQCSGNGRGFSNPRVGGGQMGNGAMGNARWKGVPLKAVLEQAGVKAGAKQVTFNGYDAPAVPETPDFQKALDLDHATDGEVMLAYEMNGRELPVLNGWPLRLVVPGYYGTYWVKHLSEINVIDGQFDGYWIKTAYRIPDNDCACVPVGTKPDKTIPINRLNIRSFITNLASGARVKANRRLSVRGIAFDGGHGITQVLLSADGGETWTETSLGRDYGRYSFRQWQTGIHLTRGTHELRARAFNAKGDSQPLTAVWNPSGYMRNVVETVTVRAS